MSGFETPRRQPITSPVLRRLENEAHIFKTPNSKQKTKLKNQPLFSTPRSPASRGHFTRNPDISAIPLAPLDNESIDNSRDDTLEKSSDETFHSCDEGEKSTIQERLSGVSFSSPSLAGSRRSSNCATLQAVSANLSNLLDNLTISQQAEYEKRIDELEKENLALRLAKLDLEETQRSFDENNNLSHGVANEFSTRKMKKAEKRLEEARDEILHLTEMLSKSHKENAKLTKKLRKLRQRADGESDSAEHVIGSLAPDLSIAQAEIGKKIDERLKGLDSRYYGIQNRNEESSSISRKTSSLPPP